MQNKYRRLFFEADTGGGGAAVVAEPTTLLGGEQQQSQQQQEAPKFLAGEDGSFTENWTTKLPDELGDYRNGLAKFKTVGEFAKSYQGLEQKLGSKANMVAIPNEKSKPEEISAYRKALGVPETADEYKLTPEKFPEGITPWPKELIAPFEAIAHKHNVPVAAMKEMIAENLRQQTLGNTIQAEAVVAALEKNRAELRKDLGDKYDSTINTASAAVKAAGQNPGSSGFTDPAVVKTIAFLTSKLSDDTLVGFGAGSNNTTLTGKNLAKDIQGNKENPENKKYLEGDPDTVAKVRRLNQM